MNLRLTSAQGRRSARSTLPRVLLVLNNIGAGQGGIENVGRSLMKLMAVKASSGVLDYKVVSLRTPAACDLEQLKVIAGERLIHCANRRGVFSAKVVWQMLTWADVVVFIHMAIASLLALVPRPFRPISLTWIHGVEVWSRPPMRRRVGLLKSDRIVSNTQFTRLKAMAVNPWLAAAVPCQLGISEEAVPEDVDAFARLGIPRGPRDVLIVGRLLKEEGLKGHDHLIEALPHVLEQVPDARLIIVGSGDNIDYYRQLAASRGVGDHVIFTGFIEDDLVADIFRRCAVYAMPSRQEGFGLVYLEAMRAGVPCIASNCDGAQEIVIHGETGLLVDPDDGAALSGALIQLLRDEQLREKLGTEGRNRFLRQFTEGAFQERFWDILRPVLPPRSRA
jgi:phosphatidylinositol alpha-1,6-mannosyltransferase